MKSMIAVVSILLAVSCHHPTEPFTEKRYTIASKETLKISALDLTITNNGCGRKWISEGEQPAFERAYCDIVITRNEKTIHAGGDSQPVYIGDLEIDIEKMNPWGREEDSVPPGGCRLWVRRVGGR